MNKYIRVKAPAVVVLTNSAACFIPAGSIRWSVVYPKTIIKATDALLDIWIEMVKSLGGSAVPVAEGLKT